MLYSLPDWYDDGGNESIRKNEPMWKMQLETLHAGHHESIDHLHGILFYDAQILEQFLETHGVVKKMVTPKCA
jgi:hypothetical protein